MPRRSAATSERCHVGVLPCRSVATAAFRRRAACVACRNSCQAPCSDGAPGAAISRPPSMGGARERRWNRQSSLRRQRRSDPVLCVIPCPLPTAGHLGRVEDLSDQPFAVCTQHNFCCHSSSLISLSIAQATGIPQSRDGSITARLSLVIAADPWSIRSSE